MNKIATVCLPQLVLWYDSTRIQTWPELLAKVDPATVFRSPLHVGKAHVSNRMTDKRHSAIDKLTRNLAGLEVRNGRLLIRGIGLLDRCPDGYRLSQAGLELREAYIKSPADKQWVRILARLLLTREPRTRVFVRLLTDDAAELRFTADQWWAGSIRQSEIQYSDGRMVRPFDDNGSSLPNLRSSLHEHSWWSLGTWRQDETLAASSGCRLVGQGKENFSLRDVGGALRSASEVLLYLGVMRHAGDRCWIDQGIARRELGAELAMDFGWQGNDADSETSFLHCIVQLLDELRTDTGFIVASELRRRLQEQGIENPDREIAKLETAGRLIIEAADYGQGRHGLGLYHDPGKQLVKLRVY